MILSYCNNGTNCLNKWKIKVVLEDSEMINPITKRKNYAVSEVIGGLTPASLLRNLNKLDCSADSARKLEAIFPADSFVSYQRF